MKKPLSKYPEFYFQKLISDVRGFAIFMIDPDGIIISWNIGCELMKGYKDEEAIGQNYEILFPDFLRENKSPQKELDIAYKNGRYETENWRRRKSGELFWACVLLTKVIDDDGNFIGYAKIAQDQSEKKKFEDELKKRNEDLQKIKVELEKSEENLIATNAEVLIQKNERLIIMNQDLDGFIYMASHDLRTPISNMEGLLSAIAENTCYKDKELNPLFSMMEESLEKLKKTIHDLTEISKVQKSIPEDIQNVSLKELIEEVELSIRGLIITSKAKIEIDITTCPVINFSIKNLRSIIYNLLSNSIKYCSPERTPEILIKATILNGHYILSFKDNGIGIKKINQEKVFTMFKRFNDDVEGTGIGLYIVKRIVDNAGGKIEVESELGKGTTFKVYFKKS